jgi:hypothetical protein
MGRRHVEPLVVAKPVTTGGRLEKPSDLRGDDVILSGPADERSAEAPLGQAEAVVRRGVEVADTGVPGGVDGRACLVIADGAIQVAELRTAERELSESKR